MNSVPQILQVLTTSVDSGSVKSTTSAVAIGPGGKSMLSSPILCS